MHVLGTAYPAPFARLRDMARNKSAIASGTLTGTEITSPARLKSRLAEVRRVWVVTGASTHGDRVGFLLAHDLQLATEVIRSTEEATSVAVKERMKDIVLFSVSEEYSR